MARFVVFFLTLVGACFFCSGQQLDDVCDPANSGFCTTQNAVCGAVYDGCESGRCMCDVGYYQHDTECFQDLYCVDTADCGLTFPGATCDTDNTVCVCTGEDRQSVEVNGVQYCGRAAGAPCMAGGEPDECVSELITPGSTTCNGAGAGTCACTLDYKVDGNTCATYTHNEQCEGGEDGDKTCGDTLLCQGEEGSKVCQCDADHLFDMDRGLCLPNEATRDAGAGDVCDESNAQPDQRVYCSHEYVCDVCPDETETFCQVWPTGEQPQEPTGEPGEPTDEPGEPTDEPVEPTDEPAEPTDEPGEPTDEPGEPTDEPGEPTDEPGEGIELGGACNPEGPELCANTNAVCDHVYESCDLGVCVCDEGYYEHTQLCLQDLFCVDTADCQLTFPGATCDLSNAECVCTGEDRETIMVDGVQYCGRVAEAPCMPGGQPDECVSELVTPGSTTCTGAGDGSCACTLDYQATGNTCSTYTYGELCEGGVDGDKTCGPTLSCQGEEGSKFCQCADTEYSFDFNHGHCLPNDATKNVWAGEPCDEVNDDTSERAYCSDEFVCAACPDETNTICQAMPGQVIPPEPTDQPGEEPTDEPGEEPTDEPGEEPTNGPPAPTDEDGGEDDAATSTQVSVLLCLVSALVASLQLL